MKPQIKKTISALVITFVGLMFGSTVMNLAEASTCFLPDDTMCFEEGSASTQEYGFWPGGSGNGRIVDKCDSSYSSSKGGVGCIECTDVNSRYYGYFKCDSDASCEGYTSSLSTNGCGQRCEQCMVVGDPNYRRFKCPGCDECAEYTDTLPEGYNDPSQCQSKECVPCPTDVTKYKCTDKTEFCSDDYEYGDFEAPELIEKHCDPEACNICYDTKHFGKYKCDRCFGKNYTSEDCASGYRVDGAGCTGKNGQVFYERCCHKCEGYNYTVDKTGNGWNCSKCPDACDGGNHWKCLCSPVTCQAVASIPANAYGTSPCKPRNEACQEGAEVYTDWDCNPGYHKSGNTCVEDEIRFVCIKKKTDS